jgi:phosphoribosylformylglycinamidine synthase
MLAVLEAARNVACAGREALCPHRLPQLRQPEKPEIAWELTEAIEGMSLACEALGIPVVSGNVSLYNETDGVAIHPTPVVGCVGLVPTCGASRLAGGRAMRSTSSEPLSSRSMARSTRRGSSAAPAGRPPRPHLEGEAALVRLLWRAAPRLTASHDVSEGGLAVALAELTLWSGIGARVELEDDAVVWFGEEAARPSSLAAPRTSPRSRACPIAGSARRVARNSSALSSKDIARAGGYA